MDHEARTYSESNFPLVKRVLTPKLDQRFAESVLPTINDGLESGSIYKTDFDRVKGDLNAIVEYAYRKLISEPYFHNGRYENLPDKVYESLGGGVMLHTIPALEKKALKLREVSHPAVRDALSFAAEMKPLAEAVKLLSKKLIKGRKPSTNSKKREFEAGFSKESAKRVEVLLRSLTDGVAQELFSGLFNHFSRMFESLVSKDADNLWKAIRQIGGVELYVFSKCIDFDSSYRGINSRVFPKDDYEEIIRQESQVISSQIQDRYVAKNTTKLAAIIERKAALDNASILSACAANGAIVGSLRFVFEDKSSFMVKTSSVLSQSKYGTLFYRFPTTFHDVVFPDGSKMAHVPSQERMIKEFTEHGTEGITRFEEKSNG